MKKVAIIQARTGSTRLPNKIFMQLAGNPLIAHVVNRLKPSLYLDDIIIATTTSANDDVIVKWADDNRISVFRGSEDNVLERYCMAARFFNADIIVRITADDPFKDYRILDSAMEKFIQGEYDFVCNNNPVSFPEGLDIEILSRETLEMSYAKAYSDFEKEHVTQYVHKNTEKFNIYNLESEENLSSNRWTIDTIEDFKFASKIYEKLHEEGALFQTEDIFMLLEANPELLEINRNVKKSDLYKN